MSDQTSQTKLEEIRSELQNKILAAIKLDSLNNSDHVKTYIEAYIMMFGKYHVVQEPMEDPRNSSY